MRQLNLKMRYARHYALTFANNLGITAVNLSELINLYPPPPLKSSENNGLYGKLQWEWQLINSLNIRSEIWQ